jgi:sulfate permease, SulP family
VQIWKKHRNHLIADFLAGITGAVAGAPQAMGFAIIAGVSPIYGLYAAILPTIVGALVSSSVFMTIGPTNAVALVTGSVLLAYRDNDLVGYLFTLTFLVGLFLLLFALLRLGGLTRFVSNAVMTGFVTGAGVLIILGQLSHLVGYGGSFQGNALERLLDLLAHLPQFSLHTTVIGILATVVIYALHRTRLKSVATLVALILSSILVSVLGWHDVALVRDMSLVPNSLPGFMLPNLAYVPDLVTAAFAVALLAALQGAGITRGIPQPDGSLANTERDVLGQGAANLVGSFFQAMPSGGSLSRTAVNISAGGRTSLSNIFAGVFIALSLLLFGSVLELIPLASLAGHLVVAALSLIRVDALRLVWRVSVSARVALAVTFAATLVLPLEYSIYVGVLISLLLYLYTSASAVEVVRLVPLGDGHFREESVPLSLPSGEPVILSVSGNLYFAAVSRLEELLPRPNGSRSPVVILRLRDHHYLGSTGVRFLDYYARQLEGSGGRLFLCGVEKDVRVQLERTDELRRLGLDGVFFAGDVVFMSTECAYDYAKKWLEKRTAHLS